MKKLRIRVDIVGVLL